MSMDPFDCNMRPCPSVCMLHLHLDVVFNEQGFNILLHGLLRSGKVSHNMHVHG